MKRTSFIENSTSQLVPADVLIGRASMMLFMITLGAYLTADAVAPGLI